MKKYEKRTGASDDMAIYMRNYRRKKNMLIPFQSKAELRAEIEKLTEENTMLRLENRDLNKRLEQKC